MNPRLTFQPDLRECLLEDRVLAVAAPGAVPPVLQGIVPPVTRVILPVVLTSSGYIFATSVSASSPSPLATIGAGSGNNGMGIATSFYINGFGLSVVKFGNSTGLPGMNPGPQVSSAYGTGTNLNVSMIVGSGANVAGGSASVAPNPAGQSLPLSPGTGFRYVGQSRVTGALDVAAIPPVPEPPVAPVAPMGPLVPVLASPSGRSSSSAEWTPSGPGFPTPASGGPALSGTLPRRTTTPSGTFPALPDVTPPLTGTVPSLRGGVPTLNPGEPR